ncbi:Calmodulin-related family protein [Oopsacas minuta]|uniref:Calmodulin-related family protein n=1 Tax=Oopsacas minuta TaxID=111878 RepID=A0AAV7JYH2_9METZ|nr:Calmodulin-related family protein [Oopsacas minuta]
MASEDTKILTSGETESFQFFDQQGMGSVSPDDVINAIQKARTRLPVSPLQSLQEGGEWKVDLEMMMSEFDTDLDGRLTHEEFKSFVDRGNRNEEIEGVDLVTKQMREVFDMFDTDKDDFIGKKDLETVVSCMEGGEIDEKDIAEMIRKVSSDPDKVSFSDFIGIVKKKAELGTDDIVDLILNDYEDYDEM